MRSCLWRDEEDDLVRAFEMARVQLAVVAEQLGASGVIAARTPYFRTR